MRKHRRSLVYATAVILLLVFTAGCAESQQSSKGLQISSMTSAMGSVDPDKFDEQKLSFTINLCNDSDQDTYISFLEPLLTADINGRIISGDTRVEVKKKVAASDSIGVDGEIVFDSSDLSKQDIIAMEPIITGFRVGTEELIELPAKQ